MYMPNFETGEECVKKLWTWSCLWITVESLPKSWRALLTGCRDINEFFFFMQTSSCCSPFFTFAGCTWFSGRRPAVGFDGTCDSALIDLCFCVSPGIMSFICMAPLYSSYYHLCINGNFQSTFSHMAALLGMNYWSKKWDTSAHLVSRLLLDHGKLCTIA